MKRLEPSQLRTLESLRCIRPPLARWVFMACLVAQVTPSATAASNCESVSPSSFAFLKQPPFVKSGWSVATDGIENTCQVEIVKASLFRVLRIAVERSVGPPFSDWLLRDGWVSAKAYAQMNDDLSLAIPLRENSEKLAVSSKRVIYSRVLKWEFLSPTEFMVEAGYRDRPTQPMYLEKVRYRTDDGKNWYLDEIVK